MPKRAEERQSTPQKSGKNLVKTQATEPPPQNLMTQALKKTQMRHQPHGWLVGGLLCGGLVGWLVGGLFKA